MGITVGDAVGTSEATSGQGAAEGTMKKMSDGEEDDEQVSEEEDGSSVVILGVPSTHVETSDSFSATLASGQLGETACADCHKTRIVVFQVSAPFGTLSTRDLTLEVCPMCFSCALTRKQQEQVVVVVEPSDQATGGNLFDSVDSTCSAAAPTDEDLEALFASVELGNPSNKAANKVKSSKRGMRLGIIEEPFLSDLDFTREQELLNKYNKHELAPGEKPFELHASEERMEENFYERMSRCPAQRFRYDYGGQPLWPDMKECDPPACETCGSDRQFEFQITPQSIPDIQKVLPPPKQGKDGFEFSTVIVFSCENSCQAGHFEYCVICHPV